MAHHDRLINDFSRIEDSYLLEFDNSCHYVNISAAFEGGVVWSNPNQIVYSPIFGTNLEDPETRDISRWVDTKTIVFISHNVSTEIWAPYMEVVVKPFYILIASAYCNLDQPNCELNQVFTATSFEALPAAIGIVGNVITCSIYDDVHGRDRYCKTPDLKKISKVHTFIDAIRLRGYSDDMGECPFTGDLAYLCDRRGMDANIETLHGDTRNRVRLNINTTLLNTSFRVGTSVILSHFDDEFTQLDGSVRKFKKYNTNIIVFRPLTCQIRLAPSLSTVKSSPINDSTELIKIWRPGFTYYILEIPINPTGYTETLNFSIAYAIDRIAPPADISLYVIPTTQNDAAKLPLLRMQLYLYKDYKLPLCLYNVNSPDNYAIVNINEGNKEYPVGTYGWAMKQRIKFVFNNHAPNGIYKYTIKFRVKIPSLFGESVFGDYFGFTEYIQTIPLQINVY